MIDIGRHNEELIRDAHTWEHVACSPLDGVMVFKHRYQVYTIYTEMHSVTVTEDCRPGSNYYGFDQDDFKRLMDELNLDQVEA